MANEGHRNETYLFIWENAIKEIEILLLAELSNFYSCQADMLDHKSQCTKSKYLPKAESATHHVIVSGSSVVQQPN